MTPVVGEAGTALIVRLGDGVVANVLLRRAKGDSGSGDAWIPIVGPLAGAVLAAAAFTALGRF